MKDILFFLLFTSTLLFSNAQFQEHKIDVSNYEATLTYQTVKSSKKAILYIHGFNDYFFNTQFAQKFLDQGYAFYALDLHGYGRNLKSKERVFSFKDIQEFDDEITQAITFIKNQGHTNITLYGYSQGGLIATLYANKYRNIDQLILDSAFFDFAFSPFLESYVLPLVAKVGKYFPNLFLPSSAPNVFGQTLHKDFNGEWDFDMNLKYTTTNAPIYFEWIHAIYSAQQQLHAGLDLQIPVLSLYSDKSYNEQSDVKYHHISDLVLDVNDIETYSKKLNQDASLTTLTPIKDGMHGVTFSKPKVRQEAYRVIFNWLQTQN
ncbi:alpha/beta hydrolase [Candidatus Marinarcus aquaticus]|uniref:Alpha/beta hydrolase n=1 Tax=Candidatus Marinarcus aquaticus TaxID=2044504 RepID=A0A4Q0XQQ4_9BACT|nr:alpha/beta hydrolase [Candidatus Marinarcus aquaticus]RXJ57928.1 alpha/beta hydrolase [Candidatus Marinarcus aquaticus]